MHVVIYIYIYIYIYIFVCVCVCEFRDEILLRREVCKTREEFKSIFFLNKKRENGYLSE